MTTRALASPSAEFGAGHYNDHHFHYGYFLYAAAVLARSDPAFAETHRGALLALVRDVANPSASDPRFPRFRHMDFFRGHSWAAGLSELGDGQDQESTSEAVNAWYGLQLLGLATGDARMRELGRVLQALEVDGARTYWQIPAASTVYGDPFDQNMCVGILFETKAVFATFFAGGPEYVYGIQMLPFTPASEDLISPAWVSDAWPRMQGAAATAIPGLEGIPLHGPRHHRAGRRLGRGEHPHRLRRREQPDQRLLVGGHPAVNTEGSGPLPDSSQIPPPAVQPRPPSSGSCGSPAFTSKERT